MPMVRSLVKRYPRLPTLFANTMVRKITEVIKGRALEPVFGHPSMARHAQDLPLSLQGVAEWVFYFLVGDIKTMPERGTIMVAIAHAALVDSLTKADINVHELSAREYEEYIGVIDISRPLVHAELVRVVKKDFQFRERLDSVLGATHDWKGILREAGHIVSRVDKQTQAYRETRRASSWWRRLL